MKKTLKRMIAACIVLVLTVSMFATLGLAESNAPDGIKEAAYTEDKCLTISTAYAGAGGAARENPSGVSTKTYYYWDDDYVYVWYEVIDPNNASILDYVYFNPDVNYQDLIYGANGGAVLYNGTLIWDHADTWTAVMAQETAEGVSAFEVRYPRPADSEGFILSPLAYIAADYTVSYDATYLSSVLNKKVLYDDPTTWVEVVDEHPEPEVPEGELPDGIKEDAYTEDKSLTISTCYSGDRGAERDNPYNVSSKTYYYWDDQYVYVWYDVIDPQTVVAMDCLYFNPDPTWAGAVYQNGGGGVVYNGTLAWDNSSTWYAVGAKENAAGVRSYEIRFPRPEGDGFVIDPVVYGAANYTISYQSSYQMNSDGKVVKFNDDSTWKEIVPKPAEPEEPKIPVTVDAVKDDFYTDDKMVTISTPYAGYGGAAAENISSASVTTWYNWDDENIYFYAEITEPGYVNYQQNMDVFYYKHGTESDGLAFYAAQDAGFVCYNIYAGDTTGSDGGDSPVSSKATWCDTATGQSRRYEFVLPRKDGFDGFIVSPVVYLTGQHQISYDPNYNGMGKVVKFDDASTWKETLPKPEEPPVEIVADGIKDAAYTEDKCLTVSTAFAGAGGAPIENTNGITTKTYYNWDDEYVYVWHEVIDPNNASSLDYLYFNPDINYQDLIFGANGGAVLFNGNLIWDHADTWTAYVAQGTAEGVTGFEVRYPRPADTEGFILSPLAYVAADHTISYDATYLSSVLNKKVLYDDPSTWEEVVDKHPEPEVPAGELPDGVKEAAYTDEKSLTISTAYAGDHGASRENTKNVSSKTYYYWDEEYIYVWVDFIDPNNVSYLDNVYFNPDPTFEGAVYQNGGGAVVYNNQNHTLAFDNSSVWSAVQAKENAQGVRSYEIRYPRPEGDSFVINTVVYMDASYTVSYKDSYQMNHDGKVVKFDDASTWKEEVLDSTTPDGPDTPPADAVVDGVKEDAYTADKMMEVSTAYLGQGGLKTENTNHIFSRTYYYWDDTRVYLWWDIYDPDGLITIDSLMFLADTDVGRGGAIYQQDVGGAFSYYPGNGNLVVDDKAGLVVALAKETGATRSWEISFEHGGRECFMINPVCYVSGSYTVSHNTAYLMMNAAHKVIYADPSTYYSTFAVDENVVTDYSKLTVVNEAMARLPEDASTLTEADRALVEEVKAVVESVPSGWLNKVDSALKARYDAAITRMLDLEALANAAKIEAVEALIAALPETLTLANKDVVDEARLAMIDLGELGTYVDETLRTKLNAAVNRINALRLPVSIDGEKDAAYEKGQTFEIIQEFTYSSSTMVNGIDPATPGRASTYADDEYIYIYAEVFAKDPVVYGEGFNYEIKHEVAFDGIILFLNPDPMNDPVGTPDGDAASSSSGDLRITVQANGACSEIYRVKGKNDYVWEPGNLSTFVKEGSYGFELRVPRVEGEENYKLNFCIVDPAGDGKGNYNPDDSRFVALGGEWAYNYLQWGEFWFEDFESVYNYAEIEEMIAALPAPEAIENKDCEEIARKAKDALAYLNQEQKSTMSQEAIAKLDAVLAALENLVVEPDCVYGDVNGDGNINAEDALWVLQAAVSKRTLDDAQTAAADVDGSGALDAVDALMILQKAVNKIDKFPVEA